MIVLAALSVVAILAVGWGIVGSYGGERTAAILVATFGTLLFAFILYATLNHNPQGEFCRGTPGDWLSRALTDGRNPPCQIDWRNWLGMAGGIALSFVIIPFGLGGWLIFRILRWREGRQAR